jgi:hypothetical protein
LNSPALSGVKTPTAVGVIGVAVWRGREGAHFARCESA